MSGVPLETCWAFSTLWNNKWAVCRSKHVEPSVHFGIINSITSCILLVFLLSHTTMYGSMNIKFMIITLQVGNRHPADSTQICSHVRWWFNRSFTDRWKHSGMTSIVLLRQSYVFVCLCIVQKNWSLEIAKDMIERR